MLGKIIAGSTIASLILLWLLLIKSAPSTVGPVGILAVFALMYTSALGLLTFLLYGASIGARKVADVFPGKTRHEALTLRKAYYYGTILALAPVMVVAMQSVNEVGYYQLLLVVIFVITGCIYITKRIA